jgi:peptidoglycan hydrolase-like protein with peptidoglycan-binding domain
VPSRKSRAARAKTVDGDADGGLRLFSALGWSARDAVAVVMAVLATGAILVNVLFMQKGSHPAPMFKGVVPPVKTAVATDSVPAAAPRARPAEPAPAAAAPAATAAPALAATKSTTTQAPRTPGEIITDIQRELSRRGYYDGTVDGLYGPKTDSAIRDFEQAAGLRPSNEPSEAVLQAILRAPAKAVRTTTGTTPPVVRPPMPVRNDTPRTEGVRNDVARNDAPDRPAPSKRVIALQRALADFGYGQIKPSGLVDTETQAAIEKFERERKLPVTGQASDRVLREMTAMTGRPLE